MKGKMVKTIEGTEYRCPECNKENLYGEVIYHAEDGVQIEYECGCGQYYVQDYTFKPQYCSTSYYESEGE